MVVLAKNYRNSRKECQFQYLMETKRIMVTGMQHSWPTLIKLQLQQNTSFYNYASTFKKAIKKPLKITQL